MCTLNLLIVSVIIGWLVNMKILSANHAETIRTIFLVLAGASGILLACLSRWLIFTVRREKIFQEEQLSQIKYMLEVEKQLFDAYRKPEQFLEALRHVAGAMTARQAFFIVLSDMEIQHSFIWDPQKEKAEEEETDLSINNSVRSLLKKTMTEGSLILRKTQTQKEEETDTSAWLRQQGIENLISIPVQDPEQNTVGILGVSNMAEQWTDTKRLECVALSFAMALNNRNAYEIINKMGKLDFLTGLMNRNSFQQAMRTYGSGTDKKLACIFVDADGLHELNNHLGHSAGDKMLKTVAGALKKHFEGQDLYRIGGDEFLVICKDLEEETTARKLESVRQAIEDGGYHASVGMEWREDSFSVDDMIHEAERKMYEEKHRRYEENCDQRGAREMNGILDRIMREKKDADNFLAVLASNFKGVYFVNLSTDSIRSIYIPEYFKEILKAAGGRYRAALKIYINEYVSADDQPPLLALLDYESLSARLEAGKELGLKYQRKDGVWILLRIYRSNDYSMENREMIWLFRDADEKIC